MSDNIANNKRIARNSIFMGMRMVCVLCITLYTTRAVLNMLGVEDYGVYNVVCGFVTMFSFLNTSMSNATQRFYNYEIGKNGRKEVTKVFNTSIVIQLTLAFLVILVIETLGVWYLYNKMVIPEERMDAALWIFQFSVVSLFFTIMNVPFVGAVMAFERMDFFALLGIIDAVLKLLIVLIIPYLHGDNLIFYGLGFLGITVLNACLYFSYSKSKFKEIRFSRCVTSDMLKSMFAFSGWNFLGSFSGMMKEQGINMIINLFFGPVVNAARGVAVQVNGALQGFVGNISIPIRPQVIQSYASGNYGRTMRLTYSVSKLTCAFLWVMALPIICEIDFILHLWLGDKVPEYTSTFVVIIILISFVNNLNSAVSGVIHASGKMMRYQIVSSCVSLFSLPAAYVFLSFGAQPEWAMISVFIFAALSQIVSLKIMQGILYFPFKEYAKKVLFPLILTMACTFVFPLIPHFFMNQGFLRIMVVFIVDILFVGGGTYFLCFDSSEKDLVNRIFKGVILKLHHKNK